MPESPYFHIESLEELYRTVQISHIFPDSKTFVDTTPLQAPEAISRAYAEARTQPDFDLKAFVSAHFKLPEQPDTGYESGTRPIQEHLTALWDVLTRRPDEAGGTLIPLPHPYVVPGGRFREIYYWDSYFTMLGLRESGRQDLILHMVNNFASLIDTVGFIPNGNRTYYLGRSQPPFFSLMVRLLAELVPGPTLLEYRPFLEKEYAFWMDGADYQTAVRPSWRRAVRMYNGSILNRYWDDQDTPRPEAYIEDLHVATQSEEAPAIIYRHIRAAAESGWDFSSRWFHDPQNMATIHTTHLIPVDLNCLLWHLEDTLAEAAAAAGEEATAESYRNKAAGRQKAMLDYCWNEDLGCFVDYDWVKRRYSPHLTLAMVYPLFFGLATPEQATAIARLLDARFFCPGGMRTTLEETGQQWDNPNGWAPLQWICYKGLLRYGFEEQAARLRTAWLSLNERTYQECGKMMEKYNVADLERAGGGGEYPNQDGFGWTNGVYLAMLNSGNK